MAVAFEDRLKAMSGFSDAFGGYSKLANEDRNREAQIQALMAEGLSREDATVRVDGGTAASWLKQKYELEQIDTKERVKGDDDEAKVRQRAATYRQLYGLNDAGAEAMARMNRDTRVAVEGIMNGGDYEARAAMVNQLNAGAGVQAPAGQPSTSASPFVWDAANADVAPGSWLGVTLGGMSTDAPTSATGTATEAPSAPAGDQTPVTTTTATDATTGDYAAYLDPSPLPLTNEGNYWSSKLIDMGIAPTKGNANYASRFAPPSNPVAKGKVRVPDPANNAWKDVWPEGSHREAEAEQTKEKIEAVRKINAVKFGGDAIKIIDDLQKAGWRHGRFGRELFRWGDQYLPGNMESLTQWDRLDKAVLPLQGYVALDELKNARIGSAVGATGFGALSERELELISGTFGSLSAEQNWNDLKRNVERLVEYYSDPDAFIHEHRDVVFQGDPARLKEWEAAYAKVDRPAQGERKVSKPDLLQKARDNAAARSSTGVTGGSGPGTTPPSTGFFGG